MQKFRLAVAAVLIGVGTTLILPVADGAWLQYWFKYSCYSCVYGEYTGSIPSVCRCKTLNFTTWELITGNYLIFFWTGSCKQNRDYPGTTALPIGASVTRRSTRKRRYFGGVIDILPTLVEYRQYPCYEGIGYHASSQQKVLVRGRWHRDHPWYSENNGFVGLKYPYWVICKEYAELQQLHLHGETHMHYGLIHICSAAYCNSEIRDFRMEFPDALKTNENDGNYQKKYYYPAQEPLEEAIWGKDKYKCKVVKAAEKKLSAPLE